MTTCFTRRDFVVGTAAGAAIASMPAAARAESSAPKKLFVDTRQIEVNGKPATRFGVFQSDGTLGVTLNEGDIFDIELVNTLNVPTSVHWHGFTEPWEQDGVPYLSAAPIPAGASRRFNFPAKPAGTRWMHSHFGLQEQNLLSAPFIVRETAAIKADHQEVVLMLDDFTWRTPQVVFESLRKAAMSMGKMDADPDLNDIAYDAVLANERTLDDPEVIRAEAGGTVRLRIINAAASSNFTVDLGAIEGTLITVDGEPIVPITGSLFPIAVAQRLDILVIMPKAGGSVPITAQVEGSLLRAGIILATKGAAVTKMQVSAPSKGPRDTLALEQRLRASSPLAARSADRKTTVDLTGTMEGYVWNMAADALPGMPVSADQGDRVEIEMRNLTPMAHPMHLHGHVFQVVAVNGNRFGGAMRDSVLVTPKTNVTIAFDATNPGMWAYHCHNLYHLAAGMFTTMIYRNIV